MTIPERRLGTNSSTISMRSSPAPSGNGPPVISLSLPSLPSAGQPPGAVYQRKRSSTPRGSTRTGTGSRSRLRHPSRLESVFDRDDFDNDGMTDADADADAEGNPEEEEEDKTLYCFCHKMSYGDVSVALSFSFLDQFSAGALHLFPIKAPLTIHREQRSICSQANGHPGYDCTSLFLVLGVSDAVQRRRSESFSVNPICIV